MSSRRKQASIQTESIALLLTMDGKTTVGPITPSGENGQRQLVISLPLGFSIGARISGRQILPKTLAALSTYRM